MGRSPAADGLTQALLIRKAPELNLMKMLNRIGEKIHVCRRGSTLRRRWR